MKKILIPILTTATIAPVATSMVACSSGTNLPFKNNVGFFIENFKIVANKKYTFVIDLSKATGVKLTEWKHPFFGAQKPTSNGSDTLDIDENSIIVKKNGSTLKKGTDYGFEDSYQAIFTFNSGLKNTDKIIITLAWKKGGDNCIVSFMNKH